MSDNRDMGIEFGDLTTDLEAAEYPMSKEEVVAEFGDRELEHASGTTTVREVLEPLGREEFDGADAVHQAILNMVGREAEGRQRYSDRGGTTPDESAEGQGVPEGVDEEDDQAGL